MTKRTKEEMEAYLIELATCPCCDGTRECLPDCLYYHKTMRDARKFLFTDSGLDEQPLFGNTAKYRQG